MLYISNQISFMHASFKLKLIVSIIAIIASFQSSFSQGRLEKNKENYFIDSAINYFSKCQTKQGIDSTAFSKALLYVNQMKVKQSSVSKIDKIYSEFKQKHELKYSNAIKVALLSTFYYSDSVDYTINYLKTLIEKYDSLKNIDAQLYIYTYKVLRNVLMKKSTEECFNYFASRLKTYISKKDSNAICLTYYLISGNYRNVGLIDMSIYNLKKSILYINKNDTVTTELLGGLRTWVNHTSLLGQLYLEIQNYKSSILYSKQAKEVRLNVFKYNNVSYLNCNLASCYIMLNNFDSAIYLLNNAQQLAIQFNDYPSLVKVYELKGNCYLTINMLDSAELYLERCKKTMNLYKISNSSPAGFHIPNYYLAKIRIIQKRYREAKILLIHEINKIKDFKLELLKEQKILVEVLINLNETEDALATFNKYSELQMSLNNKERLYRSKSVEIEAKIEESERTIVNLLKDKRVASFTKQYLITIVIILLTITIAILKIFINTKKQKKIIENEKQKSENLLLNILPVNIAEELKYKGSVEAKHFNEVTVLFTDFKGFTLISEKLTPTELVSEINIYFSAFDRIMQKHGIEKIKTIGDSYMAAKGLTDTKERQAASVIEACLDIQKFILEQKIKKQAEEKAFFEIRIGVHTGPVVAGVVGLNKFAYDIWGDSVNIASRMESSGEVGKINISGTTYELVKDIFKCEYRGKIVAKNKGDIDMYFVA